MKARGKEDITYHMSFNKWMAEQCFGQLTVLKIIFIIGIQIIKSYSNFITQKKLGIHERYLQNGSIFATTVKGNF